MPSRRQKQVAELLHQEISQLIQYRTQDPRLGFVTVTGVDVSPDLRQAQVDLLNIQAQENKKHVLLGETRLMKSTRRVA